MFIDAVELYYVELPLKQDFPGNSDATLQTVLVRLDSGPHSGWGEASPGNAPRRNGEWAGGVFQTLKTWFAPAILGQRIDTGEALQEHLEPFRGNAFAKSALDIAWWDLASRIDEKPLHETIGANRDSVPLGLSFDREDSTEAFLARIKKALDDGYSRIELKFRPGWEIDMLRFVRSEVEIPHLHIDCEAGLRLDHLDIFHRLDDFFLTMIKQPLAADDLVGHAMLAEEITTPICLDDSITTLQQAEMAAELKSCQTINLKLGRLGGITPALTIADFCQEAQLDCYVGTDLQSAIGQRAGLALAARDQFTYPTDFIVSTDRFEADLADPISTDLIDGRRCAQLSPAPGLGIIPAPDRLERYTVHHTRIGTGN
ncbi:MAG: enolase C-terminal domain-like protein [Planctomycetia bacterium]|jgi:O-succinylbenzoate synthase